MDYLDTLLLYIGLAILISNIQIVLKRRISLQAMNEITSFNLSPTRSNYNSTFVSPASGASV
jgi:hypothetical protein